MINLKQVQDYLKEYPEGTFMVDGYEFKNSYKDECWGEDISVYKGRMCLRRFSKEDGLFFKSTEYFSNVETMREYLEFLTDIKDKLYYGDVEEKKPVETSKAYEKIINWMYENDGAFDSKNEWRKQFSIFLKGVLNEA